MRTLKNLLLTIFGVSCLFACSSSDDLKGNWRYHTQFPGKARIGAVSFVIGDYAYVGLGVDPDHYEKNDFWQFNGDGWKQVAPFKGKARFASVAFSDGEFGYVGLGYAPRDYADGGVSEGREWFNDFWKFDPKGSTKDSLDPDVVYEGAWTKIESPFRGRKRVYAFAFYLDGKGYVGGGTGEDREGTFNDLWEFDVATQKWKALEVYPKYNAREGAVVWIMNDCAYLATGVVGSAYQNDVWMFNPKEPEGSQWIALDKLKKEKGRSYDKKYPTVLRSHAIAFSVGEGEDARAYIAGGRAVSGKLDAWEYNPTREYNKKEDRLMGRWKEVTGMPVQRAYAVAFVLKGIPYVTTGGADINSGNQATYIFEPGVKDDEYDDD